MNKNNFVQLPIPGIIGFKILSKGVYVSECCHGEIAFNSCLKCRNICKKVKIRVFIQDYFPENKEIKNDEVRGY